MTKWHQHLLALIDEAGTTPSEVSKKAGFAGTYIAQLQRDNRTPSIERATRIAEVLGISLTKLLDVEPEYSLAREYPVTGVIGPHGTVRDPGPADPAHVYAPSIPGDCVHYLVHHSCARYDAGDVVVAEIIKLADAHRYVGRDVVLRADDGFTYIGRLETGAKADTYRVKLHGRIDAPALDVAPEWIARVRVTFKPDF